MKIRRYYGYDCCSANGFNNGHYVDDEAFEVKDHEEAFAKCLEALNEEWDTAKFKDDLTEIENGYDFVTGYYDADGNEITREQYSEAIERDDRAASFRYVYVTYEEEE